MKLYVDEIKDNFYELYFKDTEELIQPVFEYLHDNSEKYSCNFYYMEKFYLSDVLMDGYIIEGEKDNILLLAKEITLQF